MKRPAQSLGFAVVLGLSLAALAPAADAGRPAPGPKACNATTKAAYSACLFDALDNFWIGSGKCNNEKEAAESRECQSDVKTELREANALCRDQREARDDVCDDLGQAPYDPSFEPDLFVDPRDVGKSVAPNPWFPLIGGRTLVYRKPGETVRVTFSDDVKIIDDVPCLAVRDTVEVDGELEEDTIDWFAQDLQGNVWYCGEATAEYVDGFPVSTDGSFQADVNGARPGIIMKAAPAVGNVYRQEFDLGNAEDVGKVINLHGTATVPAASCASDCLVTEDYTPLSPGSIENKYYKPGVGLILEVKPATGARLELVEIIDK